MARLEGRAALEELVDELDARIASEATELYEDRDAVTAAGRTSEMAILGVLGLGLWMGGVVATMSLRAARRGQGARAEAEAARAAAAEESALGGIGHSIATEAQPSAVLRSVATETAGSSRAASTAILRFEPGQPYPDVLGAAGQSAARAGGRVAVEPGDVLGACGDDSAAPAEHAVPASGESASAIARLRRDGGGDEIAVPIRIGATTWERCGLPRPTPSPYPREPANGSSASPSRLRPPSRAPTPARTWPSSPPRTA